VEMDTYGGVLGLDQGVLRGGFLEQKDQREVADGGTTGEFGIGKTPSKKSVKSCLSRGKQLGNAIVNAYYRRYDRFRLHNGVGVLKQIKRLGNPVSPETKGTAPVGSQGSAKTPGLKAIC